MMRVQRRSADGEPAPATSFVVPWPTDDPALDHLLAIFRSALRADGLALVTGGRNDLPVRVVCAASAQPTPDDALVAWVVRQSRPVIVARVEATAPPVRSRWLEEEDARSLVAIPFRIDSTVVGALVAISRTPEGFEPSCLAVGELAAAIVVPALEALWRAHAAERVLDLAKAAVTRDSLGDLLEEACARAVRLCDGARACVWVVDHRGRSVTSFAVNATGVPDPGRWQRFRELWPVGRDLTDDAVGRWLVTERRPLVLDDYAESPFCDPGVFAAFGTRSLVALPLMAGHRVVGVMVVDRTEVRPFDAPEVALAVSLTETTAPLVERARRCGLAHGGRGARRPEEVDLCALVGGVLAELAGPIRARGIAVAVGPLPRLRAVRVEMERVMRTLLTNAVRYIGGGPSPVVAVGAVDRGTMLECWVRDNGIGIDPADHDRIFERSPRVRGVNVEGTGVGLATVKRIVERAGGRLWVESAPGLGSTFRFTWPRSEPDEG